MECLPIRTFFREDLMRDPDAAGIAGQTDCGAVVTDADIEAAKQLICLRTPLSVQLKDVERCLATWTRKLEGARADEDKIEAERNVAKYAAMKRELEKRIADRQAVIAARPSRKSFTGFKWGKAKKKGEQLAPKY